MDSVQASDLHVRFYNRARASFPDVAVLGGVRFKYTAPTGNLLEVDLREARSRCEAIVTTGEGTGIETPISKLQAFRKLLPDFPLIVGAGVNLSNIYDQLKLTDGAIIGSYFKPGGNTQLPVDRARVKDIMDIAREVRKSSN